MSEEWRPLEARIRDCCVQIRKIKEDSEELAGLRASLADTIEQVEPTIRPLNPLLVCGLIDSLKKFSSCSEL